MDIGLSIFLSAIILGFVIIFLVTIDRWNWKRLLNYKVILPVVSSLLIIIIFKSINSEKNNDAPSKLESFWEIPLNSTKEDVFFLKGKPSQKSKNNDVWYYNCYEYFAVGTFFFRITFNNGKVSSVLYNGDYQSAPFIKKRKFFSYNLKSIMDYYGKPTEIISSKDGIERIYSYKDFNTVFFLKENKVFAYGIYDYKQNIYKLLGD